MRTLVALAVLLATPVAALAQDACKADVEKLCQGIPPGGGRIMACLKANEAKVSAKCKQEVAAVAAAVQYVGEACQDDVMKFCAKAPRGQGSVAKCLAGHVDALQPECRELVQALQVKANEFKKACGGDVEKLCKGIPPGQGRLLSCLQSRRADLSPSCQAIFTKK
jgi:Golgi apparatus protein 1